MTSADMPEGAYEAGMAAFGAGDYETALRHLDTIAWGGSAQATLARFYTGQAHLRLGMRRFGEKRFAEAADHFRHAASANPVAGGLCRYLATCYIALDRLDLAAAELGKAVEADPDDVEARIRFALATWKNGQSARAEEILRTGLARRPNDAELEYQLGTLLGSEGRFDEATDLLRSCLEHDPSHARAHARLAQCLGVQERPDEAMEHLREAQRLEPNNGLIAFQLSLLSGQAQARMPLPNAGLRPPVVLDLNDRRAVDRMATIIREDPEFLDAFLSLPTSEVDRDVFAALLAIVRRAIEECPQYADLRLRCSQLLARLGRIDEAVDQTREALRINPHYVNALIQLAQLYQTTRREDEAIARLEQAIRLGANYPDVHYLLGQLYQSRGRVVEARTAYERAVRLNGRYDPARRALASLVA